MHIYKECAERTDGTRSEYKVRENPGMHMTAYYHTPYITTAKTWTDHSHLIYQLPCTRV